MVNRKYGDRRSIDFELSLESSNLGSPETQKVIFRKFFLRLSLWFLCPCQL